MNPEITMDGVQMTLNTSHRLPFYEGDRDGVKIIKLVQSLPDEEVSARAGEFMSEEDYFLLADCDMEIYKPDPGLMGLFSGSGFTGLASDLLLMTFRKGVIPAEICDSAREGLNGAARISQNRGIAAGKLDLDKLSVDKERVQILSDFRATYTTKDGKQSKTNIANQVHSGIVGFFDSNPRNPYCRTTAFTEEFPERYEAAVPFVQEVSKNFERLIPKRWQAQKAFADKFSTGEKGFLIPGTVFTTITVNKNFQTALHTDRGDLHEGFGNLTVLETGGYTGGHTVFPKYGVAVDVRTGDFLGMDVHEWHGNTKLESEVEGEDFERVSVVCYYREKISNCDSFEEELAKKAEWKEKRYGNSKEEEE